MQLPGYIVDIDYEELRLYTGNYEQFLEAKVLAETQKRERNRKVMNAKLQSCSLLSIASAQKLPKLRQAQSRVKQLDKMDVPEVKRSSRDLS